MSTSYSPRKNNRPTQGLSAIKYLFLFILSTGLFLYWARSPGSMFSYLGWINLGFLLWPIDCFFGSLSNGKTADERGVRYSQGMVLIISYYLVLILGFSV